MISSTAAIGGSALRTAASSLIVLRRLLASCALCMLSATATADAYLDLAAGYNTGDYGIELPGDQYTLITEVGYATPAFSVSVTVPYLVLRNTYAPGLVLTDRGLGDVAVQGSVTLWQSSVVIADLSLGAGVKPATGSYEKGLGSGAVNYSLFVAGDRGIGAFTFNAILGYVKVGSPPGIRYRNIASYGLSVQHPVAGFDAYVSVQGETASLAGNQAPLECDVGVFHALNVRDLVRAKIFVGLSTGSPAYGMAVGVTHWL